LVLDIWRLEDRPFSNMHGIRGFANSADGVIRRPALDPSGHRGKNDRKEWSENTGDPDKDRSTAGDRGAN
jgi:hypothetical protein